MKRRKRRRDSEYFIGMVNSYSKRPGYSKRQRRSRKSSAKLLLRRILIVAVCLLVLAAVVALTWLAIGGIASCAGNIAEKKPQVETTAPATVPATTAPPEEVWEFVTPVIADNGEDGDYLTSNLYLWNKQGFNLFSGSNDTATHYADTVNAFAKKLGDGITLYNMVVPNHTEFGLPRRIIDSGIETASQAENIKYIYEKTDDKVTNINCYNNLAEHNGEYIFYNTDPNWTSLGAYYGYSAFCDTLEIKPMSLEGLEKTIIGGFTGSFSTLTDSETLNANPDAVEYYDLPHETSAMKKEDMNEEASQVGVYYPAAEAGTMTNGVFCWGDIPQFVIHSDCNTGKKIAVIEDTYGNAFAPYLTENYDEIHLIDYRYWEGNLADYLAENGITEVLILNNIMSANNTSQVDTMAEILG